METYLFKNARLIDPSSDMDATQDLLVRDGKIADVGQLNAPDRHTKVIDLAGKVIMPGGVDLHVHLRALKEKHKETIETGTKAARKGGITTVLAMPNTKPRLDSEKHIKKYQELIDLSAKVNVMVAGTITEGLKGKHLAELDKYPGLGVRFITDDGMDVNDEALLKQAMVHAKELGLIVMIHPEMDSIAPKGVINEGDVSRELGLSGQPNEKEWRAVDRAIRLATETNARVHLTHLTTEESVRLVRQAKKNHDNITCDVTPHHISLTEGVVRSHLGMAKVNPPLRTENDRKALIAGLKDGTVDCIASDHAPHALKEKMKPLKKAAFGFSGLEVMIPAVLTQLYHENNIDLKQVIAWLTSVPAAIANIDDVTLQKGAAANFTVIDLSAEKEVDGQQFTSLGKVTAFDGMKLKGWPIMTVFAGKVYEY